MAKKGTNYGFPANSIEKAKLTNVGRGYGGKYKTIAKPATHTVQWIWTDSEGYERVYDRKMDALAARELDRIGF